MFKISLIFDFVLSFAFHLHLHLHLHLRHRRSGDQVIRKAKLRSDQVIRKEAKIRKAKLRSLLCTLYLSLFALQIPYSLAIPLLSLAFLWKSKIRRFRHRKAKLRSPLWGKKGVALPSFPEAEGRIAFGV